MPMQPDTTYKIISKNDSTSWIYKNEDDTEPNRLHVQNFSYTICLFFYSLFYLIPSPLLDVFYFPVYSIFCSICMDPPDPTFVSSIVILSPK